MKIGISSDNSISGKPYDEQQQISTFQKCGLKKNKVTFL